MVPFLKWPGGKRWLAPAIRDLSRLVTFKNYIEPFLGGGAVFFAIQPREARLSDVNRELVATYCALRDSHEAVLERLRVERISKRRFMEMRCRHPRSEVDIAVRLLYLNRTAFNGLYRVNFQGHFNVPFGCKPGTKLCHAPALVAAAQALRAATIEVSDFRVACSGAQISDLVYLDPPYTVTHNNNGFRRYNEQLFSWSDQVALADVASELAMKGVHVVLTNAWHIDVRRLYRQRLFYAFKVDRRSNVAANAHCRGATSELLLVSKSIGSHQAVCGALSRAVPRVTDASIGIRCDDLC